MESEDFSLLTEVSGILEEIENSYSLCLIMEEKVAGLLNTLFDLSDVKSVSINIAELFMSQSTFTYYINILESVLHSQKSYYLLI